MSQTPFNPRYDSLDHWRGIAALAVMVFHGFHGMVVHSSIQWLAWLASFGWFGVHLFFVISGYCIAANVCRLAERRLGPWDFFRDRLLRIYPTYWGACLFALALALISMPFNQTTLAHNLPAGPVAAVANVLLVEPYTGVPTFLLVSWSLVYELGFYLLVVCGFGLARAGVRFPWLMAGAIALGFLGLLGPWQGAGYILNFWPEFLAGGIVFLALWFKARQIMTSRLMLLIPVAFALVRLFAFPHLEQAGQMIGAAIFAMGLYLLHPFDERISKWRPLVWLAWVGTFSYSLYLVHVPLGRVTNLGIRFIPPTSVWFIFLIAAYWVVAITGGWVFYRVCEAPLERWRHTLRRNSDVLRVKLNVPSV
ncbi:MAG TPA: acyltransferase [Verrucomicrobiae bacterium]|nr:acyltransferase [Verrucomicrobiae bacterium]